MVITSCLPERIARFREIIVELRKEIAKLPEKYKIYLNKLSEFAFKMIESDKIIFSDEDIEKFSPELASSSKKLQGLGLLKATEHTSIRKMGGCIWYNFLHLSIHEFLAAYYLKSLTVDK